MDPLSIAGLGLGAAGLAFQLFAGCVKGFVLLSTAYNLGKDSSTLLCMLNVQELQLTGWARRAGLLSAAHELDRRLNATIVQDILKELRSLLLDTGKLKTRYRLGLNALSDAPTLIVHPNAPPSSGALGVAISDETRGEIMFQAGLINDRNSFPQRLRWAAIDKSRFEEYVSQIRYFVQELWNLLDPIRHDELASGLQTVLSHVIGMCGQVEELNALKETLQHSSINGTFNPSANQDSLASAAGIKAIGISLGAVSGESPSETPPALSSMPVSGGLSSSLSQGSLTASIASSSTVIQLLFSNIHDFVELSGNPEMGIARYNGEIVLIEWKQLPALSRNKIMARVQNLAMLLSAPKHPSFRALQCRGIARDPDAPRIAFVFDMPRAPVAFSPPRPLRSMFQGNPSVTERLDLALKITQSVRYFHMSGWLHKNIRSSNILILPFGGEREEFKHPLALPLLAGFAFSRLDSASEISEQPSSDPQQDIYRHPDAMGEPSESFTAAKDIYALGTVLLEIGEWRSLKSLVDRVVNVGKGDVPLIQLAKIRPFLLDDGSRSGLATLQYRMGDVYASVTRMMLQGEIPRTFGITPPVDEEQLGKEGPPSDTGSRSGQLFAPNLLDVAVRELSRCII
ncbi:MAG: hypothetical protein L6R41_007696 [Letrouitia leprolyta]|nr:MAG: hypothetical protein L6R41_007696 [Letrouitia leprolyta]